MDTTTVSAYLGVPMPSIEAFESPDDESRSRKVLYTALDELCAQSGQLEFHLGNGVVTPEISVLNKGDRDSLVTRRLFRRKQLDRSEILYIETDVSPAYYDHLSTSHIDADRQSIVRLMAQVEFCKRVSDLLVMANVSRVGSLEVVHSVVLQDDEPQDFSHIPKMAAFAVQNAAVVAGRMSWPNLREVPLVEVWRWYVRHRESLDGFDGTAMGRALCAFSRLFEQKTEDEPMQLLWALVGLEAVYAQGKSQLAQQLRDKAQAFLGPQVAFKKNVSRMYDFRSRFVHGDLDFPGLSLLGDARETVARFDDELTDATAVAVALLAGTLQEVIRRDWDGVHFDYAVSNARNVPT